MGKIDRTGQVFGWLTVLRENGRSKGGKVLWLCKCRCGNEVTVRGDDLKSEHTTSCGCFRREKTAEKFTTHGLSVSYPRLYTAIRDHFHLIKNEVESYGDWQVDPRYTLDSTGMAKFCEDLIALQPDECDRYERDKSLVIDKDNDRDHIFRPESIVFVSHIENCNNQKCTKRLKDGTAFTDFCRSLGIETCSGSRVTKQYSKYHKWFKRHNGEGHPELVQKANDLITLYSKCLKLLKLRDEIRAFADNYESDSTKWN